MTGGIIQVVAKGVTDIFLTVDPQITFFKTVYRRHTNFSKSEYDLRFSKRLDFGRTSELKIQRYGDLLHRLFLVVDLPEIDIVFRSLTVEEVQELLQPFDITWETEKPSNASFTEEDLQEVTVLVNRKVRQLEVEVEFIDGFVFELTEGFLEPQTWFANTGYDESNSLEYFADMADYYFEFDPLSIQWQFFIAHRNDQAPYIPLANSSVLQENLFDKFRSYSTGESIAGFDPTSYNDENLFFIFNVDTANYNVTGSTNLLSSNTVFTSGIQGVYGDEEFEFLDSYKIFDSFLAQDTSLITSNFDIERIKEQLIITIRFGLRKNIQQLNTIYNSLQADAKFMFYRLFERRVGGFDTNATWINLSLANNIDPDLQDRYTTDFPTQALPDEPNDLFHPMAEFVNNNISTFHTNNRESFRNTKFKAYFDAVELWARTDVGAAGICREAITGSPNGAIPQEFFGMYFLNYIPIFSTADIPRAMEKILVDERDEALNNNNQQRADSIQDIIDQLIPILNTTRNDITDKILPKICIRDDFVTIFKMNDFRIITGPDGDIVTNAIIRQNAFLPFNGVNYVLPEYVIVRYNEDLQDFSSQGLPLYDEEFKTVLTNVLGLFNLPESRILDYATYENLDFNSSATLRINTPDDFFSDIISSIWIILFKEFVSSYNQLYDRNLLGQEVYEQELGVEILSYRDTISKDTLGFDPENPTPIEYYFESTLNDFQRKLPINGGEIGTYLLNKLATLEAQLIHFTENFKLLNIKSLIIPKPTYYFEEFVKVLDFITLENLETVVDADGILVYDHKPHNDPNLSDPVIEARRSLVNPNHPNYDPNEPHDNAMDIFQDTDRLFSLLIRARRNPFNRNTDPNKHALWNKLWLPTKSFSTRVEQEKYDNLFGNISPETLWTQVTDIDVRFNGFASDLDIYLYQSDIVLQNALLFTFDVPRILAPTVTESNARAVFFLTFQGILRETEINLLLGTDTTVGLLTLLENSLRGGDQANFAWIRYIGHYLIDRLELFIGDQLVDTQCGEWLHVWHQLTKRLQKEKGYNELVGNVPELYTYNNVKKRKYQLIIPLKFFFNLNVGAALPLVALQHTDVRIKVKLKDFDEVTYFDIFTKFRKRVRLDCHMIAEYIFLEEEERKRVVQAKHEYIVEKLQYNGDLIINKDSINEEGLFTTRFYFKTMVKEIVWMLQDLDLINGSLPDGERRYSQYGYTLANGKVVNPTDQIKVKFASRDREPFKGVNYYNYIQPYERHNATPDLGICNYCFAINPENHQQPSGAANLGRLDDSGLEIMLREDVLNDVLNNGKIFRWPIYSTSYNVFRVMSGLGGLGFFY